MEHIRTVGFNYVLACFELLDEQACCSYCWPAPACARARPEERLHVHPFDACHQLLVLLVLFVLFIIAAVDEADPAAVDKGSVLAAILAELP